MYSQILHKSKSAYVLDVVCD